MKEPVEGVAYAGQRPIPGTDAEHARDAYALADAMLKAREETR